jgi:AcrR family transcriptional regulator
MHYDNESNVKKKKRKLITDTAKKMFREHSLFTVSMNDISEKCSVGRSTMYEYYSSKDELLAHIRDLYLDEVYEMNIEITPNTSGLEQLESILNTYFDNMLDNPSALLFFSEYNRLNISNEKPTPMADYTSHVLLQNAVLNGMVDGSLNSIDLAKKITIIVETLIGAATRFSVKNEYSYQNREISITKNDMSKLIKLMLYGIN